MTVTHSACLWHISFRTTSELFFLLPYPRAFIVTWTKLKKPRKWSRLWGQRGKTIQEAVLPGRGSLCWPHNRPMNRQTRCWGKEYWLHWVGWQIEKIADSCLQKAILCGPDARFFYKTERARRQWHPTPVLLPGKSHVQRSLVGCSPWGR